MLIIFLFYLKIFRLTMNFSLVFTILQLLFLSNSVWEMLCTWKKSPFTFQRENQSVLFYWATLDIWEWSHQWWMFFSKSLVPEWIWKILQTPTWSIISVLLKNHTHIICGLFHMLFSARCSYASCSDSASTFIFSFINLLHVYISSHNMYVKGQV